MPTVRVNVKTTVNNAAIRREQKNRREVLIVPSVTMPDDIIMNGIKYPADVIRKSYISLNKTPAPYGHPQLDDGTFLSAIDPEGLTRGWIGAWNENVRQIRDANGRFRVHVDKVIDVNIASQSELGREVLEAINTGDPVHTSTGLYANVREVNAADHSMIATDIEFDHDAILLHEDGAATPADGVGLMVNSSGKETIQVFNSFLEDAAEWDGAALSAIHSPETEGKAGRVETFKTAMREVLASMRDKTPTANKKESEMEQEQFEALMNRVDGLATNIDTVTTDIDGKIDAAVKDAVKDAVKPLTDQLKANADEQAAKEQAELDGYVERIVKANMMPEAAAKELTLNAAKALAEKIAPGTADTIAPGGLQNKQVDVTSKFQLPKGA